jgi:hypothetical protein
MNGLVDFCVVSHSHLTTISLGICITYLYPFLFNQRSFLSRTFKPKPGKDIITPGIFLKISLVEDEARGTLVLIGVEAKTDTDPEGTLQRLYWPQIMKLWPTRLR